MRLTNIWANIFTRLSCKIEAKIQILIAIMLTARIREHSFIFELSVLYYCLSYWTQCATNENSLDLKGCLVPLTAFYRPVKGELKDRQNANPLF